MLPPSLVYGLGEASLIGFSGSRSVVPPVLGAVFPLISCPVLVGCAQGVDAAARAAFPNAKIFSVASFGRGRGAFAARSAAFVRAVAAGGGLLLSFPAVPCPAGLLPSASSSRAFSGGGSGSWASLSLAVGLGVPCFLWLPPGVACPAGWGFVPLGGGWFAFAPSASQLSLF